jgi:tricorn protease
MKYRFYDEKMHGVDWARSRRVRAAAAHVGENEDVYDLANEMIGELNASHTGVSGPPAARPTAVPTRHLGFELEPPAALPHLAHLPRRPADKEWLG